MAKVISITSRRRLGQPDFTKNDALVAREGRYLGNLPSSEAKTVRRWHDMLTTKLDQINELVAEYENSHAQYLQEISYFFSYLKIPGTFNPALERLFIHGDDGHIWAVKRDDKD